MFRARSYQDWEAAHLAGTLNEVQERFWRPKPFDELYDVVADPHQIRNLVDAPAMQSKLAELRNAFETHMLEINDNGFIPEGLPLQGYIPSRRPAAYPLDRIMARAGAAAERGPKNVDRFVAAWGDPHEVMGCWGAQGLLILGADAADKAEQMRIALDAERSVAVRIALAEALVNLTGSDAALRVLGTILDQEDDGPFRLQSINALTYVGRRAVPVLPAIRRAAGEDHRHVKSAAAYLLRVLEGTCDPHAPVGKASGYVPMEPAIEGEFDARYYD